MESIDPEQNLGAALLAAVHSLEKALNEAFERHGMTYRQVQVLSTLNGHPRLTQIELARLLRIEAPTIVRILDRMERNGWVERKAHAADRRKKVIHITSAATDMVGEMSRVGDSVVANATRGISQSQQQEIITSILMIRKNLEQSGGIEP